MDDCNELLVSLIENLGRDQGHILLIEQKPVRVLALKDGEVRVEEGAVAFKVLLSSHLLLDVIGSVHQVI